MAVEKFIKICIAGDDINSLIKLLKKRIDIDTTTLLHIAIIHKREQLALLLLKMGANPFMQSSFKKNALHYAVQYEQLSVVKMLLVINKAANYISTFNTNKEILFNVKDYKKRTPLHLACKKCNQTIIELLLKSGASQTARDKDNKRPIDYLQDENSKLRDLFKLSIKLNSDTTLLDKLQEAIRKNDKDVFQNIVKKNPTLLKEKLPNGVVALFYICDSSHDELLVIAIDLVKFDELKYISETGETLFHRLSMWPEFGKQSFERLLKMADKAYINKKDNFGFTALHYACLFGPSYKSALLVQYAADVNAQANGFCDFTPVMMVLYNVSGTSAAMFQGIVRAVKFNRDKNLKIDYTITDMHGYSLQQYFCNKLEMLFSKEKLDDAVRDKFIELIPFFIGQKIITYEQIFLSATTFDSVELACVALKGNIDISKDQFNAINEDSALGSFLRYKPGKKQKTVYELYCDRKLNSDLLKRLYFDYLDTSSEESSDSDMGSISSSDDDSVTELDELENSDIKNKSENDLSFVLYRGLHWNPKYFNKKQRNDHHQLKERGQPAVSLDTLKRAGMLGQWEINENNKDLKNAHNEVTEFFKQLEKSPDTEEKKKRKGASGKKSFSSLFFRFVQAYVNKGGYHYLFVDGALKDHFNSTTGDNPVVSTTYLPDKAMHYSAGTRVTHDIHENRLNPHYRRSTQKPKHSRLGVVYVYAVDLAYVREHGIHILDFLRKKEVAIGHVQKFDQEIFFKSILPGRFQIYRETFCLPSFAGSCDKEFEQQYGYQIAGYTRHKKQIASLPPLVNKKYKKGNKDDKDVADLLGLLGKITEKVIEKHAENLEEKIKRKVAKTGKQVVYPFAKNEVSPNKLKPEIWNSPDSPRNVFSPSVGRTQEEKFEKKLVPSSPSEKALLAHKGKKMSSLKVSGATAKLSFSDKDLAKEEDTMEENKHSPT